MTVRCFMLEPIERAQVGLRRYTHWDKSPDQHHYHSALNQISECFSRIVMEPDGQWVFRHVEPLMPSHQDPRWPTHCKCGYGFLESDEWQVFTRTLYRRSDTGELTTIDDAPPGAMYDALWIPWWGGPDGLSLMVKCPNGASWWIDGRASNCTMPDDDTHRCWIRHGDPPRITVDKAGVTCAAGAGSIQAGDYHGFLRDGVFT